jgi:hypothetical protein
MTHYFNCEKIVRNIYSNSYRSKIYERERTNMKLENTQLYTNFEKYEYKTGKYKNEQLCSLFHAIFLFYFCIFSVGTQVNNYIAHVAQKENYTVHKCRKDHLLYFVIICMSVSDQSPHF